MAPFFIYTGIILALPFIFPAPKTTVILLDNNKSVNGVTVTTQGGSVNLDSPNTQTVLSSPEAKPEPQSDVAVEVIQKKYAQTLDALPPPPASLLFYFEEGSIELTPESKAQTHSLMNLIKTREPCMIDIIGHTDTEGSEESNYALALERAGMVKTFLSSHKIEMKEVTVRSDGESDLLVKTGDNVPEPRNRRVEVIVR